MGETDGGGVDEHVWAGASDARRRRHPSAGRDAIGAAITERLAIDG